MKTTERDGYEAGLANKPDPNPYIPGRIHDEWQHGYEIGRKEREGYDKQPVNVALDWPTPAAALTIKELQAAIRHLEQSRRDLKEAMVYQRSVNSQTQPECGWRVQLLDLSLPISAVDLSQLIDAQVNRLCDTCKMEAAAIGVAHEELELEE